MNTPGACLIALTYKRKVLLKRHDDASSFVNKNTWGFIENRCVDQPSSEDTIRRGVLKEINIFLPIVTLLSSGFDTVVQKNFYIAELTDHDVNALVRHEGHELQFFTLGEADKLIMTDFSRKLLTTCRTMIKSTFVTT